MLRWMRMWCIDFHHFIALHESRRGSSLAMSSLVYRTRPMGIVANLPIFVVPIAVINQGFSLPTHFVVGKQTETCKEITQTFCISSGLISMIFIIKQPAYRNSILANFIYLF